MANENLKTALHDAGLTAEQFAELIQVDPKTVQRWLAGRTPYTRHRATAARALDTTEHALWPHLPNPRPGAADSTTNQTDSATGDVIATYPNPNHPGCPDLRELISQAGDRIELLDHALAELLQTPGMVELLAAKADAGCAIRILLVEPGRYLEALLGQPGIEICAIDGTQYAIHRADEHMLLTLRLAGQPDNDGPRLHLQRQDANGIFDRLIHHFEALWENLGEPINTRHDLAEHDPEGDENSDDSDLDQPGATSGTPGIPSGAAGPPARIRNWPGRNQG